MKHRYLPLMLFLPAFFIFQSVNGQIFQDSNPDQLSFFSSDAFFGGTNGFKAVDIDLDGTDELVNSYYTNFGANPYIEISGIGTDGTGRYESFTNYANGDFNEDGFLDFVGYFNESFGPDVNLSVMLSDDTQEYLSVDFYGNPIAIANTSIGSARPQAMAVGDVDNDGHLDIVTDEFKSGTSERYIYVYNGDGTGGFGDPVEIGQSSLITGFETNFGLELVDFNRNDTLDLVLSSSAGGLEIYPGTLGSSFDFDSTLLENNSTELRSWELSDVDDDGFLDLFYNDTNGDYIVLNGNNFPLTVTTVEDLPSSYIIGDFTGDGLPDVMSKVNPNFIFEGDGTGGFNENQLSYFFYKETAYEVVASQKNTDSRDGIFYDKTSVNPREVYLSRFLETQKVYAGSILGDKKLDASSDIIQSEIADINGDDINDLVALSNTDLVIFYNSGDGIGTFEDGDTVTTTSNLQAFQLINLGGDNDLDIVVGAISGTNINFQVIENNTGTFSVIDEKTTLGITDLAFGDVDGDDIDDIVASCSTSASLFFKGTGTGFNDPIQTEGQSNSVQIEFLDFDVDGNLDAIFGTTGTLTYYKGNGTGGFERENGNNDIAAPFKVIDLNADGIGDLVGFRSGVSFRLTDSTNTTLANGIQIVSPQLSSFNQFLDAVDLNDDGNPDLVGMSNQNTFGIALGDGDGNYPDYSLEVNDVDGALSIGDINGDNRLDAVIVGGSGGVSGGAASFIFRFFNDVEIAPAPTTGVTNLVVEDIKQDSATIKWSRGDGERVLVLATDGGSLDGIPEEIELPVDGEIKDYNASAFFGSSVDINNANVIYDGEGDSVVYYNLPISTEFNIAVLEYNGSGVEKNFLTENVATTNFTTLKGDQEVTISQADEVSFIYEPFGLGVSLNSGLNPEFNILSGNAEIDTLSQMVLTGLGEIVYSITNPGDDNWNPLDQVNDTINIVKGDQTINFNLSPSILVGFTDLQLPVYTSNDLPITYTIDSGPGSLRISGDTTFYVWDGEGTLNLTASQPGNDFVNTAVSVTRSTNISKRDQNVFWQRMNFKLEGDLPQQSVRNDFIDGQRIQFSNDTLFFNASSSAQLPVSYVVTGPTDGQMIPTEIENAFLFNSNSTSGGVGEVTVSAFASGNGVYNSAPPVDISFTIVKGEQEITWDVNEGGVQYEPNLALFIGEPVASSGLPINLEQTQIGNDAGVGTIEEDSLHVTQAGSFVLSASQAGNENWNSATPVSKSYTISKANQFITVEPISDKLKSDDPFELIASSSSGLDLTINSSMGKTSIENKIVTINQSAVAGLETLILTQQGDANYLPAQQAQVQFCISPDKLVITEVSDKVLQVDNNVDVIEWYLDGSILTTTNIPTLNIDQEGSYTAVAYSQNGCSNSVESDPFVYTVVLGLDKNKIITYPNPVQNQIKIEVDNSDEIQLNIFNTLGQNVLSRKLKANERSVDVSSLASGNYLVQITGEGVNLSQRIIKQ